LLSIRKTKTASGSTSVQIVYYKNRKVVVEKHIGSGKTKAEVQSLIKKGKEWIEKKSLQEELFPKKTAVQEYSLANLQFLGVTHRFAYELFQRVALRCGIDVNKDRFVFDFAIMRLIEPASKLRTITLLGRCFDIYYSERTVYRKILKIADRKQNIEKTAVKCAKEMLQEDLALILYDVTTLYFETFKSDELRISGFSKDNKPQQPQIVVGLIVTRQGFPLSYEVFSGNTFEGKTMLSVLDNFTKNNGVQSPIVVADAAMLSQENIKELKQRNLSYIVGARLGNTSLKTIKNAFNKLESKDGNSIRIKTDNGELIVEFSKKRYNKDKYEMEKQIQKAKQLVEGNQSGKRVKFVKHKGKESLYMLNEALIEKAKLLLGMKGYHTNIPAAILSDKDIIARYHDLWRIEQAFRIAKSDLASRPVFHHKSDAVKSHILICFTALMISKFLEINIKLSLRQIIDAIWEITDAKLYDKNTDSTFTIRAELDQNSKDVVDKLNEVLSY
jgi:transposase